MPRRYLRSVRFCNEPLPTTGTTRRVAPSSTMLARSSAIRTEMPAAPEVSSSTTPRLIAAGCSAVALDSGGTAAHSATAAAAANSLKRRITFTIPIRHHSYLAPFLSGTIPIWHHSYLAPFLSGTIPIWLGHPSAGSPPRSRRARARVGTKTPPAPDRPARAAAPAREKRDRRFPLAAARLAPLRRRPRARRRAGRTRYRRRRTAGRRAPGAGRFPLSHWMALSAVLFRVLLWLRGCPRLEWGSQMAQLRRRSWVLPDWQPPPSDPADRRG